MKKFTKFLFVLLLGAISLFASCKKEINEVTFTNVPTTMYVDDAFTVEYSKQDKVTVEFTSSNTSVATVAGEKVTALAVGEFTLTATFTLGKNTKEYTFDITVKQSTFAVTYENDGSYTGKTNATTYSLKALPVALVSPTKEGYSFSGWYLNDVKVTEIPAGTTGDIKLVAKWAEVSYNINYQLDGGVNAEANPATYTVLDKVTLAEPTKVGYNFLGWYLDNELVTEIAVGTTGDVEVVAKWELANYNITYNLDGGVNNEANHDTYTVLDKVELAVPTKEGYAFLGWYLNNELVTEIAKGTTGDLELVAAWQADSYNIKYNLDGGVNNEANPSVFTTADEVVLAAPTKAGYDFLGWYTDEACTTPLEKIEKGTAGDVEVYAKWELAKYNINYNLDGGTNNKANPATFTINDEVTLAKPTKTNFTFVGWFTDEACTIAFEKIAKGTTADVTVYAKWEKVSKTIKYNLDGGVNPADAPESYYVGEGCKLPVPTKEGYNFLGWTTSKTSTTYITEIADTSKTNVVLYAQWEKIKVYSEIEYVLDGGELIATSDVTKYVEGEEFVLPVPTQEGFKFLGWSLKEGSTEFIKAIPATSTGKVTVYANWEEYQEPVVGEPFTVNYELNGGEWSWTTGTVTDAAKGIDAVSNLPEIFMADFYTYLLENNLLSSSKVASSIRVTNWADFSKNNGDPVALYNTTSTVKTGAADGYSELFFDSVNGYEAVGGFLGTSPYKEKYANVTKHMIQMTLFRYPSVPVTDKTFKAGAGFVLDGYFYGTQGLLANTKANYAEFNALRALIPTPTVGYDVSNQTTNSYVVTEGVGGTELKLVAPVKEGNMFLGWYDNPSFEGEAVTSVKFGCTLYAYWFDLNAPAPEFNINYELNGGKNADNAPITYTQGEGVQLVKPTQEGYTFIGWSLDAEGLQMITSISKTAHGDITVYAQWVEGEDEVLKVTYVYTEGKLPTRTPDSLAETIEYVFTSYYNWLKPNEDYETFKTNVINQWKGKQSQGSYQFYKQGGQDTIDAAYFCNAPENFEEWNAWFTVFDAQVTAANGAQNAWNSYVGILRLGQWLSNSSPTTWKDSMNQALINATHIKLPLATEVKVGESFTLLDLVIEDGRTFLGWYDEQGNKVEVLTPTGTGSIVLTAKWSEATPVESFTVTNPVEKLLKLSTHQLNWVIGPDNATFKKVTFASSNEEILTVSEKGLIEAHNTGTAKVLITVHGNTALNMELEIEVYVDPYVDGEFEETSYVVKEESIQLSATVNGVSNAKLAWKSNTPSIASVDESGAVTGIKEGVAEIVAYVEGNEKVAFTFYVTVLDAEASGILKLLLESNNSEIFRRDDLGIGAGTPVYYADIYGSVSQLLFEDYVVHYDYYLENPSNSSTYSTGGVQFVTLHYAADMPQGGSAYLTGGKNLAAYNQNVSGASWHFSTGMDGIWACQTTAKGAWHAGSSKTMTWFASGVKVSQVGTDVYTPHVTLGSDGYYYIKGVKTKVQNTAGNYKLNKLGLAVKLEGDEWYIGGAYYNSSYQWISSVGGNNNSIGIESSVREKSDLWLTWQYSAQLCASLLLEFNLPIQRLVGHHFFSGKDCPQPMLENEIEIWWEFLDMAEKEMELFKNYKDVKLSFSSSSSYLQANGRVKNLPNYPECVTYTITYTTGSTTKTITLSSILSGRLQ